MCQLETVPLSVNIGVANGTLYEVIPRNTLMPTRKYLTLEVEAGENSADFKVYLGQSMKASDNFFLGSLTLEQYDEQLAEGGSEVFSEVASEASAEGISKASSESSSLASSELTSKASTEVAYELSSNFELTSGKSFEVTFEVAVDENYGLEVKANSSQGSAEVMFPHS
mmetsp:Transcript_24689/g.38418  ORF Transcript_24689/g.38418 Transcript_24689/m.38418 type:complete len:169 (-) Transcript_24689:36-542(-)